MRLDWLSARPLDAGMVAGSLGVSREAIELTQISDWIDLHVDTFIWTRMFGYDPLKRHGPGPTGGRVFGQADLPRLMEAGLTGIQFVITTNPFRPKRSRRRVFFKNLERALEILGRAERRVAIAYDRADYIKARSKDQLACFIAIQGGNALDVAAGDLDRIPKGLLTRITLVHLSNSELGATSNPSGRTGADRRLTRAGREYVEALDEKRILVDLAHISREGFFDAIEAHDGSLPVIVTHTGVTGVREHWRNLDDRQLRAVADTGGTVGVMYQGNFLGPSMFGARIEWVVDHLEHIVKTVGEDHASLGSDWDGAIVPPTRMPTCLEAPRLVQIMLDRGFSTDRIQKILGGNFLRVLGDIRPRGSL